MLKSVEIFNACNSDSKTKTKKFSELCEIFTSDSSQGQDFKYNLQKNFNPMDYTVKIFQLFDFQQIDQLLLEEIN